MNYITVAKSDIGIAKEKNQDSISVRITDINGEQIVFAVVCDGVGGLELGEDASTMVNKRMEDWFVSIFPKLLKEGFSGERLREQWESLLTELNRTIQTYGKQNGVRLGTTVTLLLFYHGKYYIAHVGDSRAYEIADELVMLTQDQTVVAMDVRKGLITEEQANMDPRRSILLQCVGASDVVVPDFYTGEIKEHAIYMLCSDGFRHKITTEEIYRYFSPNRLHTKAEMSYYVEYLIDLIKRRKERDNISVVLIRTY